MDILKPEQRAERMIREAEAARARVLEVPGRENYHNFFDEHVKSALRHQENNQQTSGNVEFWNNQYIHSSMADEDYMILGGHIDEITRRKIYNCEYIDFGKLLARDRFSSEEDQRLVMIQRDNQVYWVPANEKESNGINSFSRWEQAFRIFSNIFCQKYPEKAGELLQYNHVIHTASLTYHWENVYSYDKDFRIPIARHPYHSWSVILQQSWSIRLKDRINRTQSLDYSFGNNTGSNRYDRRTKKDVCWHYNSGRCTYGNSCKFEHKCAICLKFGHGSHICRKANDYHRSGNRDNRETRDNRDRRDSRDHYYRDQDRRDSGHYNSQNDSRRDQKNTKNTDNKK